MLPALAMRFRVSLSAFVWALAWASAASAQTVSILNPDQMPERRVPQGDGLSADQGPRKEPTLNQAHWVNYQDCVDNLHFRYNIKADPGGCRFEFWAGQADCANDETRNSTNNVRCFRVVAGRQTTTNAVIGVDVPVRQLIAARTDVRSRLGLSGTDVQTVGPEVCDKARETEQIDPVSIGFYPICVSGDKIAGSLTALRGERQPSIDVMGPVAPTNVRAGVGDGLLLVQWDSAVNQTTFGFRVFNAPAAGQTTRQVCEDVPVSDSGTSAVTDAASTVNDAAVVTDAFADATDDAALDAASVADGSLANADAGASTTTTTTADAGKTCRNEVVSVACIAPWEVSDSGADAGSSTLPQNAGVTEVRTVTSAVVSGLQNNVSYAVAVAALDNYGNPGTLSTVACATPVLVDDFWQLYREKGGRAGGGFCALEAVGMPAGAFVLWGWLSAVGITVWRRRRKA